MSAAEGGHAVTDYVAGFVVGTQARDIPSDVAHFGKRSVLDGIGLALAGAASECGGIAQRLPRGPRHRVRCRLHGDRQRPAPARALRGLRQRRSRSTPTTTTIRSSPSPRTASMACSRIRPRLRCRRCWRSRSATAAAAPISCSPTRSASRSSARSPRRSRRGTTRTASTAPRPAARSARPRVQRSCWASIAKRRGARLSIGATQAGGLRENFGTMTKPFHAGRAAENGVTAAEIAALGFTASPNGLEADRGFFRAAGGGYSPEMIVGKLGEPWTFRFPGRLDQAASVGLAHPSGHGGDDGAHPRARHQAAAREARGGRHQPQHAQRAHPPPPEERAAGQVQHGVLHGHPAARAQARASTSSPTRSSTAPDVQAMIAQGAFRRASRGRGRGLRQDDDDHRDRARRRHGASAAAPISARAARRIR